MFLDVVAIKNQYPKYILDNLPNFSAAVMEMQAYRFQYLMGDDSAYSKYVKFKNGIDNGEYK